MSHDSPKVVFLGSTSTGKTSLITRIVKNTFDPNGEATAGCVYYAYPANNPRFKEIHIWDTAGMERFRAINGVYYRYAAVGVLVFDLTAKESFDELEDWLSTFERECINQHIVVVVGNKSDLVDEIEVTETDINGFLQRHPDIRYFKTSACKGDGVREMIQAIVNTIPYTEPQKLAVDVAQTVEKPSGTCC